MEQDIYRDKDIDREGGREVLSGYRDLQASRERER